MKLLELLPSGYATGPLKFAADGIPTYEECRELIRTLARHYWHYGEPGTAEDHWLKAEWTLFLGTEYRIYVCYGEAIRKGSDEVYEKWEVKIVTD